MCVKGEGCLIFCFPLMNNGFDLVMKAVAVLCVMSELLCFWGAVVVFNHIKFEQHINSV